MGNSVRARCDCGFDKQFLVGGGMVDFQTKFLFPCYCTGCKDLVTANLLDPVPSCEFCKGTNVIPYDDLRLCIRVGDTVVSSWKDRKLTNGRYRCPGCQGETLTFGWGNVMWD